MAKPHCCICGGSVRDGYWVCLRCRRDHELPGKFIDWPQWAKALKGLEQDARRYYEDEEHYRDLTYFEDYEDDDGNMVSSPSPFLHTRLEQLLGLPLSPYDNDADNAAYRRANRLPDPVVP